MCLITTYLGKEVGRDVGVRDEAEGSSNTCRYSKLECNGDICIRRLFLRGNLPLRMIYRVKPCRGRAGELGICGPQQIIDSRFECHCSYLPLALPSFFPRRQRTFGPAGARWSLSRRYLVLETAECSAKQLWAIGAAKRVGAGSVPRAGPRVPYLLKCLPT